MLHDRERSEIHPEEIFMDAVNIHGFRTELAEGRIEQPISRSSLIALGTLIAFGLIVFAGRLADLTLAKGRAYAAQAQANRIFPILIAPPRGVFYDRNFEPLVENTPTFEIALDAGGVADDGEFTHALTALGRLTSRSIADIAEANGVEAARASALLQRSEWPVEVFIASGDLRAQALEIKSRPADFPGAFVRETSQRRYLLASAASHLVGYVGRPSRQDLARSPDGLGPSDAVGKDGLEAFYDTLLRGSPGEKLVEVNADGDPQRERFIVKAAPGRDVVLEVDAGLQQFAADTLARHIRALGKRAGALVAIDPRDGGVRALVSYPSYAPDALGGGVSRREFERLVSDPARPFFNRAISGGYPSASTVKPLLAAAALDVGIIAPERQIYDPGYISVPNPYDPANPTIFKDWKALGMVDMRRAIALSANVYFYTVGGGYGGIAGLGIERIGQWFARFGWGSALGIDLPGEFAGLIPSPEKKPAIRPADPTWRIGDTYITSIGQGDLQITPLQLAAAAGAIANGGTLWKPRVARAVVDEERQVLEAFEPQTIRTGVASAGALAVVREGMRLAVTEGTAAGLAGLPVQAAGKTGTAQTGAYGRNHGWFVGFAPYAAPEIVIAVLVEEGTGGSTDAVPIAREVLYYYFTHSRNPQLTAEGDSR